MRGLLAVVAAVTCAACAGMPRLEPAPDARVQSSLAERARLPFLTGRWRLVHSIEADLPGGHRTALMGVTESDAVRGSVHAVMMSLEGVVLFDGIYDGQRLSVARAVPPFDRPSFARGMIDDITLMLFAPRGDSPRCGSLPGGRSACRFVATASSHPGDPVTIDVVMRQSGWEVRRYASGDRPGRLVTIPLFPGHPLPQRVEIRAPGPGGYRLQLSLVESEPVR